MHYHLPTIGPIESVYLPEYGIDNVLAKIDTGADSSTIWASNISENDRELTYTLFGPASSYYTGETIRTKKYSKVIVKNSFGQKERRYKVTLKLSIAQSTIISKVTLANRNNSRFPILIGRRTLKGKFIVDVTKSQQALDNHKVLMLLANKGENNKKYVERFQLEGIDIDCAAYSDLVFSIDREAARIVIRPSGCDISDYGLVYFKTSLVQGRSNIAAAIAHYLEARKVDYIDRAVGQSPNPDKVYQVVLFADHDIPIPKTIFMLPNLMKDSYEYLLAEIGLPFILKDSKGRKNRLNYLVDSKSDFDHALHEAAGLEIWLMAQQYIPNDCDYRLLTLGGKVALAIKRTRAASGTHLNNISQGVSAVPVDLNNFPPLLIKQAEMATKLCQFQIAGVDMIQDKASKLWYCLEVNKASQIHTGSFVEEKELAVAKYLKKRLGY
jgi:glutathione synthase/RimK-type ligase-like ATP-grasp enzyme